MSNSEIKIKNEKKVIRTDTEKFSSEHPKRYFEIYPLDMKNRYTNWKNEKVCFLEKTLNTKTIIRVSKSTGN